jgi:Zn-dependent peptidase ImmA (M78 family)/transcriptional regulator with XRE-family HTH domain
MSLSLTVLGKRLREARINSGLTQEAAAQKIAVTRTALVQIEAGNRSVNTFELVELAKLYRADISLLLSEHGIENDDPLVALCRIEPHLSDNPVVESQIRNHVDIFREGVRLEQLLEEDPRSTPPVYDFPEPKSYTEAVRQGQELATQERKRLNLGFAPLTNVATLITAQGIWAAATNLSDDLSGLFLHHPALGMAILINNAHTRGRRRFSYCHEYAHALADRKRAATVTSRRNSNELIEKRANAFAIEFLMPTGGVESALERLNRGGLSRQTVWLYDVANDDVFHGEKRVRASSRKILSQDVALLAYEFQVSYQAAAYKLSDLRYVSRQELSELLAQKENGKAFLQVLRLKDPEGFNEEDEEQTNLTGQIGRLIIEAYRRKLITQEEAIAVCRKLKISGEELLTFAQIDR